MQWFITNFYNIRFFPKEMLPVSTCMWDPKWYQANPPVRDKRGVVNGYNCFRLHMPEEMYKSIKEPCSHGNCDKLSSLPCKFMTTYAQYLKDLSFESVKQQIEEAAKRYGCTDVCLMVAERPQILCAERPVLRGWFKSHGIDLIEWTKLIKKIAL